MLNRTGLCFTHQSLCLTILFLSSSLTVQADGGYFAPPESIAVSSDQQAVIWQFDDQISMALSTAYTGGGGEFAWIIPTPAVPLPGSVAEGGKLVKDFFSVLDYSTAPEESRGGGCFPSGTPVLTDSGPRPIEAVAAGTVVLSYDISDGRWVAGHVVRPLSHEYSGDLVTIRCGAFSLSATGNHPFYVVSGPELQTRPPAADVPAVERRTIGEGRWVCARDVVAGDVLLTQNSGLQEVVGISRREVRTTVYNLEVSVLHNYAVGAAGVLVHNKGGAEADGRVPAFPPGTVSVHESMDLEHYHTEVLSSSSGTDLFYWLRTNGYQVDDGARDVLESYVNRGWSFIAIRLQPGEQRDYRDEFLPPVMVRYRSDELVFPLLISSASTMENIRLSLYVIAESTVRSTNFPTRQLQFNSHFEESTVAEAYIEQRIERTSGYRGQRLTVLWSGRLSTIMGPNYATLDEYAEATIRKDWESPELTWEVVFSEYESEFRETHGIASAAELAGRDYRPREAIEGGTFYLVAEVLAERTRESFPKLWTLFSGRDPPGPAWDQDLWLTRLEGRMGPSAMTDDIELELQSEPESFRVSVRPGSRRPVIAFRFEPAWNLGQNPAVRGFAPRTGLALGLSPLGEFFLVTTNLFYQGSPDAGRWVAGADLGINMYIASLSPRMLIESVDSNHDVWLGFSAGFIDVPPLFPLIFLGDSDRVLGVGIGAFTWSTTWNTRTGERRSSIGCPWISVGMYSR